MTTLIHVQTTITYEESAGATPDHPHRPLLNSRLELPRTRTARQPLPDQIDCPWASKGS